jgi:hypothetical protein
MCSNDDLKQDIDKLRGEFQILGADFKDLQRGANKAILLNVKEMIEIREIVTMHKESNDQIIEAWETVGGVINFVKALGKLAAACTAIGVAIYGILHWRP